jgi:Ca-activated chloride channel homolog
VKYLLRACITALTVFFAVSFSNPARVFAQQAKQLPAPATIRVVTSRVNVNVTVTDSHGGVVNGLRRDGFRVFDDGIEQPITSYASNEDPSQVVLMVESGTADFLLGQFGRSPFISADALLRKISPSDRLAIVTYSDHAYVSMDFTPNGPAVRAALENLNLELSRSTVGSNSLDLSSSLAAVLYWLRPIPGKKVVVLLSTGIDTSSPEYRQFVDQELKTSDIPILAVSVLGDLRKVPARQRLPADDQEERFVKGMFDAEQWLQQLAQATGGRTWLPENAKDFDEAYADIAQFIQGEYSVGFVPDSLDGKLHSLTVRVNHPWYRSYQVENRQAYIAAAPQD